jgi:hypothetical protein
MDKQKMHRRQARCMIYLDMHCTPASDRAAVAFVAGLAMIKSANRVGMVNGGAAMLTTTARNDGVPCAMVSLR